MAAELSYFISYGILGGPLKGKIMRRYLNDLGFKPSESCRNADIIIAHSAGCWLIDPASRPKLVVYVGLPLKARSLGMFMKATRLINQHSVGVKHQFNHAWWAAWYGITRLPRNLKIVLLAKNASVVTFQNAQTICINNRYDPWLETPSLNDLLRDTQWAFIGLSGSHDNIWEEPEKYTEVIKQYARLLA